MNQTTPHVGVAFGGAIEGTAMSPMVVESEKVARKAKEKNHILLDLNPEDKLKLETYLGGRLAAGLIARNRRIRRYAKIDRLISTWQKLSPEDSERERIEDNTGKQAALPMNLPVLASHLSDMVSYFAEALAPISNPFFSASGDVKVAELLQKFNRDAAARDYYGNLSLSIRSLLKYNLGGFRLKWDTGEQYGKPSGQPGNCWKGLDLYNTMWDPSVRDPKDLACKGEWAATICLENRLELMRRAIAGEWAGLDGVLSTAVDGSTQARYYREPAIEAAMEEDGLDSRTTNSKGQAGVNWGAYNLGVASDLGPEVDGFEVVEMSCWLIPAQFGLLTDVERVELEGNGIDPELYLELWDFTFVSEKLVDAKPTLTREESVSGEKVELPFYLAYLTQDQMKEAQRSMMELLKGFQRFSSAMYNIYIAGMRGNVWGLTGYDPTMFDLSKLPPGETVGRLPSKINGRDVRTGIMSVGISAGVDQALQSVDSNLALKDKFFPSQAMPGQVAGIDRAVKSQVHTVVQGSTRSMRTTLRILDSSLMLPSRMGAYRNLKRRDPTGINELTDEDVAKLMGSGIESMEAERVSEILWQLMYAIIQNQEAMQMFDVPQLLAYLSRVGNLSVDLGQFARKPATPVNQEGAVDPETGQLVQPPQQ